MNELMSDGRCPLCRATPKTWSGSDPKCSFDADGKFTNEGWNCATMGELRSMAGESHGDPVGDYYRYSTRTDDESIGVVYDGEYGFIVMTWYKNRGRTGMAVHMADEQFPELLTIELAESAIKFHKIRAAIAGRE